MAVTRRSDLIDPQVLTDAIQSSIAGMKIFPGTRVAMVSTGLPRDFAGVPIRQGSVITVPYFNLMGNELDELVNETDALTPVLLSMSTETATVRHWGKAGEITHWARMVSRGFADPYAEIGRQFRDMVAHTVENTLIAKAADGLPSAYKHDVFNASTPHLINWDDIIEAKFLWGDEVDTISLITVHSKVAKDLQKMKDSTGRPLWLDLNDKSYPTFNGVPVKISDKNVVTTSGGENKYQTLLFRDGALAFWFSEEPHTEEDSDILADTDLQAIHVYGAAHRYSRVAGGTKPGVTALYTN